MPQEYPIILRGFPGTVQVVDGVEYAPGRLADVYLPVEAAKPVPTILFLHAGGWLHGDRKFGPDLGRFFTQRGFAMVSIDYRLSDEALFPAAVHDVKTAVRWMRSVAGEYGFNPNRIGVWGLSAGGHLAAMMLACSWKAFAADLPADLVKNALSISGLYDLEPMRHAPNVKDSLKLTPAQVRKASPALLPAPRKGTLYSVAGGIESAEFLRHNQMIQQAWGKKVVPVSEALPGLHHFSVLDALLKPTHRLHQLALQLMVAA